MPPNELRTDAGEGRKTEERDMVLPHLSELN